MKQQRLQNIEHPDLTQMEDYELTAESLYLLEYSASITDDVLGAFGHIGGGKKPSPPISKIIEDLRLCADRYQAICQEAEYRKQMMR